MGDSVVLGQPLVVCFSGAPGSGKGTQASILSQLLDMPVITAGDLFRAEAAKGTRLAQEISADLREGRRMRLSQWLPVVQPVILGANLAQGVILDGILRAKEQLSPLMGMLSQFGVNRLILVHLNAADDVLVQRLKKRARAESIPRTDNQARAVNERLKWSKDVEEVLALAEDEGHVVVRIDGSLQINMVHAHVVTGILTAEGRIPSLRS